jgi:hypothetical protein
MNVKRILSLVSASIFAVALAATLIFSKVWALATEQNQTPYTKPAMTVTYQSISMNPANYMDSPLITLDTNGDSQIFDMGTSSKFCPADSGYICIDGGMFRFAIPRRQLKLGEKWRFHSTVFQVVPLNHDFTVLPPQSIPPDAEQEISIMGNKVKLYAIAAKGGGDITGCYDIFLFSPERGLLADMNQCKTTTQRFSFLEEQYGPGSQEFDTKIPAAAYMTKDEVATLAK